MDKRALLIADDDAMSRELISSYFSNSYQVFEAKDGKGALEVLHSTHIDVAILDIVMPEVDGYEVLQQVKCDEKYRDLRVLVATSHQEKTERRALELGADDIVFKPFDPVVLKKRVDNLVTMQEQKRELEHALLHAEHASLAKTEFLSRVSHDMRTPLNGILGIVALLKDRVTQPDMINDLEQLELSGQYLLNLVNDTLDVNKIEVGKLELHPCVCDGRAILNNVIGLIRPNMESKGIDFVVHASDLPFNTLFMDMGRLEQVFMNILGNAVKFTPEGGTVECSITNISSNGSEIWDRIVVRDTGMGMSADFLPHLFEPFSQENPSITGNTTGTGLGMTITKQIIDLMGGTIEVQSVVGEGTTYTIVLPLHVATVEQTRAWNEKRRIVDKSFTFTDKRVLLCEDHPLNANITRRLLERKGITVELAENGKVGLEKFSASPLGHYDLVLMDIRMPVMDGLEATRLIRSLPRVDATHVPIVALTANAFYEDLLQAQNAGMNAHLSKPIEVDALYSCLSEMMQLQYHQIKKEILVVDDIEVNRVAIRIALGPDFGIYEATDGKQALELLDEHPGIDMVITDIQMPGMGGMELIRRIRANKRLDHVIIIANTQFGDPEQEESILVAGADDFVYKPTTPKIVELRVKNLFDRF